MANKPQALELASQCDPEDAFEVACARELRFLDAVNKDWAAHYEAAVRERDEVVTALKDILNATCSGAHQAAIHKAWSLIDKIEGTTTT